MGSCCGKPERKEGYVLGGSNSSSTASQQHQLHGTSNANPTPAAPTTHTTPSQGHVLGGSTAAPVAQDERMLSPSALAAQKRAEAATKRGVQAGGGKLSKKLAEQRGKSHFEPDDKPPEHAGSQWN